MPEDLIIFCQSVQLHDTQSIHAKVEQELIICHVHTNMQHLFPIAVQLPI